MDDIVARLREEALRPAMKEVCSDAADEIERLNAAMKAANEALAMGLWETAMWLLRSEQSESTHATLQPN